MLVKALVKQPDGMGYIIDRANYAVRTGIEIYRPKGGTGSLTPFWTSRDKAVILEGK